MRADVEKCPNFTVLAPDEGHRFAGDRGGAEVERRGQLALVQQKEPGALPDFLQLFLENLEIGVDAAVDEGQVGSAELMPKAQSRVEGLHGILLFGLQSAAV